MEKIVPLEFKPNQGAAIEHRTLEAIEAAAIALTKIANDMGWIRQHVALIAASQK